MSQTGSAPRGFMFWALAPFLLIFVVAMPFLVPERTLSAIIALIGVELFVILLLLGLFNPDRFWWAFRGIGALVFAGYCAYLVSMLVEAGFRIAFIPRRGEASLFNAILGFVIIGLPSLWYALFGRFTLRAEPAGLGTAHRDDGEWERRWNVRMAALESVLGPADDGVFHAVEPFDICACADVVVFRQNVPSVAYVTSDLIGSEFAQPNSLGQYELMICVPDDAEWAASLMSELAGYTIEAVLEPGETMDIVSALPQPTDLTAFVFDTYATFEVDGEQTNLLLCLGITADELKFAHEHGTDTLLTKLKDAGIYPITDVRRNSALATNES